MPEDGPPNKPPIKKLTRLVTMLNPRSTAKTIVAMVHPRELLRGPDPPEEPLPRPGGVSGGGTENGGGGGV